ncbi:uncharacterized protein LOC134530488 isoform X2 [Bacillus rossius redtenbacheri]|uniref:uncharacterized protein LOC134530488 isoform X2 n=1 Tax=Bacillus rossius redtenbacheri TaxID=93214 RepID=UPI002FDCADDE
MTYGSCDDASDSERRDGSDGSKYHVKCDEATMCSDGRLLRAPKRPPPPPPPPRAPGALRLVVDTDAGTDDAAALFLLLGRARRRPVPAVHVAAITCVQGNTGVRNVVANVLKVLQTAGRLDVPVYAGASQSLLVTPPSDNYFGADGFGDVPYPDPPDPAALVRKCHAANALVELVDKYPGEITVVCLGPLTNLALAIRLDPMFLTKVQRVVVLGGSAEGVGNMKPGVEFNFYMDPEADFIVLNSTDTTNSKIKPIDLVPWETIKEHLNITMDWRASKLGALAGAAVRLLNAAERKQLLGGSPGSQWLSADPVAMAVALYPDLVKLAGLYRADVETRGVAARGTLLVDYGGLTGASPNVRLVQRVDQDSLQEVLLENLS